MKVGDLVRHNGDGDVGIITCIDPEEARKYPLGDHDEAEVAWASGEMGSHSTYFLEVINEAK